MTNDLPKKKKNNIFLKGTALIIGYMFWYIFGGSHPSTITMPLSVCFYNLPADTAINAPESISVTLAGKRRDLRALDHQHLGVHIDASRLCPGKQLITVSEKELMIPSHIKLVEYAPVNPTVELLPQKHR